MLTEKILHMMTNLGDKSAIVCLFCCSIASIETADVPSRSVIVQNVVLATIVKYEATTHQPKIHQVVVQAISTATPYFMYNTLFNLPRC